MMLRLRLNLKLARRQYYSVGILLLLTVALAALQPYLWQFVRDTAVRFHQGRSQIHQLAQVEERLAAIQQEQQDQEAQLPHLAAVVPEDKSTLSRLERLEAVAATLGVSVQVRGIVEESLSEEAAEEEATPAPGSEEEAPTGEIEVFPLVVSLTASAPPTTLLDYIDAVEHLEELVQVRSVRLSSDQASGGGPGIFGLTMEVVFYLQRHGTEPTT
jgi:hypothetical protein